MNALLRARLLRKPAPKPEPRKRPPAWFKGDVTAWAMFLVCHQWVVSGIDKDS